MPKLTPGRILYLLYHYPRGELSRSIREGGPWEQWLDHHGREEMRQAARHLPALSDLPPGRPLEVHQLTGRAFLFQSLFSLWSLAHSAQRQVAPIFYDDGTLTTADAQQLREVFPTGRIVSHAETSSRLEKWLPIRRYPFLRDRFHHYVLIRKLINIHLASTGWKLVLDADTLFFRRPTFLLEWLNAPHRPLYMLDVADAYGYPREWLEKLAGRPLPACVNVGLCGLRSDSLDWDQLESWCAQLIQARGTHYLLEQALTALLLAGQSCSIAPAPEYVVLPDRAEGSAPRAVMHHYVAESKRWYFRSAWKHALLTRPM